jgi:DNA-binding NarL/FixJ family response regulator
VRIVIGEDSVLVREGLASLLVDAGHDIVAKVCDAEAVVAAVERHDPDLLITDIRMPPSMTDDGARAARELRLRRPTLPIVLLSQHIETRHSVELVATGAFGYLLKDRILDLDGFLDALYRVAAGGSALDPEVVASLVQPRRTSDPLASLTEREREVLALLAEGRSNAAIAQQLWTASRTVETHVRHIFVKLGLFDSDSDHRRVLAVLTYLRRRMDDNEPDRPR